MKTRYLFIALLVGYIAGAVTGVTILQFVWGSFTAIMILIGVGILGFFIFRGRKRTTL